MRYPKGTIHLNESKDIPLLLQIFQSAYATQPQLFEFMKLRGYERSEAALKTRLARLVKHELVKCHTAVGVSRSLYAIGETGRDVLVYRGVPYAGRGCGLDRPLATAQHSLDLNGVHLAFLRSGRLRSWLPETEICSCNILTSTGYAKDYDAIATIADERDTPITFALEYERTPKTDAAYQSLAIALNRESRVDFVLYATATPHLFAKVSGALRHCRQNIAVCLASDLNARVFDTTIVLLSEQWKMTLKELLDLKRKAKVVNVGASEPRSRNTDASSAFAVG